MLMHFARAQSLAATLAVAAVLLTGCGSGPSAQSKKTVNAMIAAGNYDAAEKYLETNKERGYGKKNMVLFYLDKGAVLHHAGKYEASEQALDQAETRMNELYTKSITKAGGMLLLNDTTVDYAGEPFERALTNVIRALNYVFMGKPNEALVESRKVEAFLDELNAKLEGKNTYKDDAFARYLDALLYADEGKLDDARISMQHAQAAYETYATTYNTPFPKWEFPEDKKKENGELVFIHYNGVAPRKISKTFQIAWGNAIAIAQASRDDEAEGAKFKNAMAAGFTGRAITVGFPDYVQDPFTIVSSDVVIDSTTVSSTLLVEDITAIATKTLQDRMAVIKTRAIARATVKFVIAEAAARAASKECDRIGNPMGKIACKAISRGIAHGVVAALERADTRAWSSIPAQIRMARVKIPPGKHYVQVNYKNAAGLVVATRVFPEVEISKSKRTYLHHRTAI